MRSAPSPLLIEGVLVLEELERGGPVLLRFGRTQVVSSLKTSSLAAAPSAEQSRAAGKVMCWLPCGVIFRGSAPLHEVLGCISRAALVHNIVGLYSAVGLPAASWIGGQGASAAEETIAGWRGR